MKCIYILTNPSFPEYVKIGYSDDVERRLKDLNHSEALPYAFRLYATYELKNIRLADKEFHKLIDKLNPTLRSIETFEGKKRIREFYEMSAEDAYALLESIAKISGTEDRLTKYKMTAEEKKDEQDAVENRKRAKPIDFSTIDIPVGSKLELWFHDSKILECEVVDNKKVMYNGKVQSLSSLVRDELNIKTPAGPDYFKYNGKWINDIRRSKGEINF